MPRLVLAENRQACERQTKGTMGLSLIQHGKYALLRFGPNFAIAKAAR